MHLTGVQARSQVTNPLMQIPPKAAGAGREWAAHPLPTGAQLPRAPAKRGSLGDTSDSNLPPQKHHPSLVTLPPLQRAARTTESQDTQ